MLLGNQGQSSYLQTKIQANTAVSNTFETNLKLHERVAVEVNLLELAMMESHFEKKARHSKKSIEILMTLDTSLDLENPNELVMNIHNLYEFCIARIFEASKELDATKLIEVKTILSDLKDGWKSVAEFSQS